MTNASTYTYEVDLATMLGGVTRADAGKKGVQEFLSTDPLTSSYPMLTPYQFASNTPIMGVDLDGLELMTIHSADFTELFLKKLPELHTDDQVMAYLNELSVKYGTDHGGYFNANSLKHASQYYDSPGEVVHESPSNAPLTVFGYLNATTGDPMRITLYDATVISEPQIDIAPPSQPGMKNQLSGVQYAATTFMMKNPFGKLTRSANVAMEGIDDWTGEPGNAVELAIDGTVDLVTLGGGPIVAGTNVAIGIGQDSLNTYLPSNENQIGVGREALDIALSGNKVDVGLNMIQAVIATGEFKNPDSTSSTESADQSR